MKVIHVFTLIFLLLTACERHKTKERVETVGSRTPVDSALELRASRLAGIDSSLMDSDEKRLARNISREWGQFKGNILDSVGAWSQMLRSQVGWKGDYGVFYPFSGPDVPFALSMFPSAHTYVLVGLERAGSHESVMMSDSPTYSEFLTNAPRYFYFSSKLGFFRTNDMEVQFEKKGVLDIIAFYLKKMDCAIIAASLGTWDAQKGVITFADSAAKQDVCQFMFRKPDGTDARLVYFSKDLSDKSLSEDPRWRPAVAEMLKGRYASMAKSASYLMHRPGFGIVRSMVLDSSRLHIQDDSGVSYSYIVAAGRPHRLYGRYTRTIPLFSNRFEPGLRDAYAKQTPPILPFKIGYNTVYGESNLQVLLPLE